jgi:hypothetical protein
MQAAFRVVGDLVMHSEPFMCGHGGNKDPMGLPDYVLVCPAKGLDGFCKYKRDGEYSGPGW